jgi:nitrate reductase gamma subunit
MSAQLDFAEHRLQEMALLFMAVVYLLRVRWLLRFKAGRERQAPTGSFGNAPRLAIISSWANIAMPWAMECTRSKFPLYLQFATFHLGVTAAITLSFIIPYAPGWLYSGVLAAILQIVIGAAFLVGLYRIGRRLLSRYMRAISSPDDYFSLILLTAWFALAFFAVPNNIENGEGLMMAYFVVTAFFIIYVPFSKISHYLYYPFTRYYLGKTMGRRGVFPLRRTGRGPMQSYAADLGNADE